MNEQHIYKTLKQFGKVKLNAILAKFSTFKIGGQADFLIVVDDRNKLVELLKYLQDEGVDYLILGGGSNVLFSDDGFRGVVIQIKNEKIKIINNIMEVDVGMSLGKLVELSIQNKLSGLEWATGIPGTIGGAIRGNAGAHYLFVGGEIKDNLEKVEVWRDGEVLEIFNNQCEFGYRDSIFKHNRDVILRAWFKLRPGDQKISLSISQKVLKERQGKHPAEPSAGSFFKNIPLEKWTFDKTILPSRFLEYKKVAAGWVIEQCGLRGFKVGGAMISERHGNFLINADHATQEDVLKIVEEVKERVYNRFGVELEEEAQIIQ